jgi:flagellar M-ring protein FliF
MDSLHRSREKAKIWISDRRNKSIVIAAMVLMTLVILQVGKSRSHRTMCALFPNYQLRATELQRIQIALGKAGMREYEVNDFQLLVPQEQHAQYLQAIADHGAEPVEFQEKSPSAALTNPFLSYSQQLAIQRESRNRKLQERLMLLPFVEQAWFEMDESSTRQAFHQTEKSAVVTIRPKAQQPMLEQQLYTVRQIVGCAVSGLCDDRIVIVDLETGFAHQGSTINNDWEHKLSAQRIAYSRQHQLEQRLRERLQHFNDLRISVVIEPAPEQGEQTASSAVDQNRIAPTGAISHPPLSEKIVSVDCQEESLLIGANGQMSLESDASFVDTGRDLKRILEVGPGDADGSEIQFLKTGTLECTIQLASHTVAAPMEMTPPALEKVTVMFEIPEELLAKRYAQAAARGRNSDRGPDDQQLLQIWLDRMKTEVEQIVRPVLASQGFATCALVYNLVPQTPLAEGGWMLTIEPIFLENWPSIAVILFGIGLIFTITDGKRGSRGRHRSQGTLDQPSLSNGKENDTNRTVRFVSRPDPKAKIVPDEATRLELSEMIERDPDAAARVIENWIRDAA